MAEYTEKDLNRLKALVNIFLDPKSNENEAKTAFSVSRRMLSNFGTNLLKFDADGNSVSNNSTRTQTSSMNTQVSARWVYFLVTNISKFAYEFEVFLKITISPSNPNDNRLIATQKINLEYSGKNSHAFTNKCRVLIEQIKEESIRDEKANSRKPLKKGRNRSKMSIWKRFDLNLADKLENLRKKL